MNQLALAIKIASEAHQHQVDKGGMPYILHPIRIMQRLRTDDQELMQIAVLHDVLEDTEWTVDTLTIFGFSQRVIDALVCLTHKKNQSYDSYIEQVLTNKDAILVKIEDLRDNSDITRLKGVTEKDTLRMIKYHKAFLKLKGAL